MIKWGETVNKNQFMYKIRRISDGLYSAGGTEPTFSKSGKVWKTKSALGNHLSLVETHREWLKRTNRKLPPHPYADCELVVLEVKVHSVITDVHDYRSL